MLVLSRRREEKIIITVPPSLEQTRVEVMVVEIRGEKVRLGVQAGETTIIHRHQVQAAIDAKLLEEAKP